MEVVKPPSSRPWLMVRRKPDSLHPADLDTENKKKGSFSHFFRSGRSRSTSAPRGASTHLSTIPTRSRTSSSPTWVGEWQDFHRLFNSMYESIADTLSFTAIGVVTSDPASVESLLNWAAQLQNRVSYLVVLNQQEDIQVDFTYWERSAKRLPSVRPLIPPSSAWRRDCLICSTPLATTGLLSENRSPRSVSGRDWAKAVWWCVRRPTAVSFSRNQPGQGGPSPMNPDMFDNIAKYVPEEHLTEFWRVVSRLRQLRPDDEILNIFRPWG